MDKLHYRNTDNYKKYVELELVNRSRNKIDFP